MKIYFGASVTLDRSLLPMYERLVSTLKEMGHDILSEQVIDPHLLPGEGVSASALFSREAKAIEQADVMIAEVTVPSWGTAFLMEHALECGVPVIALFYKDQELPLPKMIEGHPELYVSHYDEDNLKMVLQKSLKHLVERRKRKGKLIVIDGGDGSGKATQTQMLLDHIRKKGEVANFLSFPRYKTSFHGKHVGRFLIGEFGGNQEVSPYLSSLAFALDRLTAKDQLEAWLNAGNMVVLDRYVSANMAHQGSKLKGKKQKEFLDWIYHMEYKEHKLPKEDVVLFLYVPVKIAQKLMAKTQAKGSALGRDMAEVDLEHQKRSIETYQMLAHRYKHWAMVECVDSKGNLLSREAVHAKILEVLKERSIL